MLKKIASDSLHISDQGWLKSRFHFTFAEYRNPENLRFGALRVLNDDLVKPGAGFPPHPHKNMEIISYVVKGELTHQDNMGNERTLNRGHIQYMSAGKGIMHSEYNMGENMLRFLQIWIPPEEKGLEPNYGDHEFPWQDRKNHLLHLVSGQNGLAPVRIHQDVNFYAVEIDQKLNFPIAANRQAYVVLIEGEAEINGILMSERDAMEAIGEELIITPRETSHLFFIEMAMSP